MFKRLTPDDEYYQILKDYQKFVQQAYCMNTDSEWDEANKICGELFYKYHDSPFFDYVIDLVNAHYKDVERRTKR